jgi:hypothetical protein
MTELLLMFAARNENLERVMPALVAGKVVVSDRFSDASMAYQGAGRGLGRDAVERLAELVHGDLEPDLTLLLDVPVDIGMERIKRRSEGPDRFEQTRQEFLERVRQGYLEQAERDPQRFAVIDAASRTRARCADEILRAGGTTGMSLPWLEPHKNVCTARWSRNGWVMRRSWPGPAWCRQGASWRAGWPAHPVPGFGTGSGPCGNAVPASCWQRQPPGFLWYRHTRGPSGASRSMHARPDR